MKRRISVLMALVLTFALATPVFAVPADVDIPGTGTIPPGVTPPAPIFGGVVPTNANLNFTIDPYGLLDLVVGEVFVPGEPVTNIVQFAGGAPILETHSTSEAPVLLTAELSVTGGVSVGTQAAVTADTERNLLFWLELNTADLRTAAADPVWSGFAVPFSADDAIFRFDTIPYNFVVTDIDPVEVERVPLLPGDRTGTAFRLGGIFNHTAGWPNANLSIQTTFTMVQQYTGSAAVVGPLVTVGTPAVPVFGMIASGENLTGATSGPYAAPVPIPVPVGFCPDNPAAVYGFTTATFARSATGWVEIPFFYGADGSYRVASVTNNGGPVAVNTGFEAGGVQRLANVIRLNIPNAGERTIVVTFTNGLTSTIVLSAI